MVSEPSTRVVLEVAQAEGVPATELPPLHEVVDPDALDALFEPATDGTGQRRNTEVRFTYAGHEVRVAGESEVTVDGVEAMD